MTTTTKRHEWNTGRLYSANGQPIIAEVTPDGVHFYDRARGIYGTIALPAYSTLSDTHSVRSHVMRAYDRNEYTSGPGAFDFWNSLPRNR